MSQPERWQIEGNAPESYERHLVPTTFTPWAEDLLTRVALQPGERVLDVACGTGIVARLAAAAQVGGSGHVVGQLGGRAKDRRVIMSELWCLL